MVYLNIHIDNLTNSKEAAAQLAKCVRSWALSKEEVERHEEEVDLAYFGRKTITLGLEGEASTPEFMIAFSDALATDEMDNLKRILVIDLVDLNLKNQKNKNCAKSQRRICALGVRFENIRVVAN